MKSVIQEASSIAKAIDQAWEKAGKPADFTIKILEQPQKNFFGFTTRSAKVSLCFEERVQGPVRREGRGHRPQQSKRDWATIHPSHAHTAQEPQQRRPVQPRQEMRPSASQQSEQRAEQREMRQDREENRQQRPQVQWEQPMIDFAREWLSNVLKEMDRPDITFTVEPSNAFLRFTLSDHLIDNIEKEKRMLAGMSLLMLEAIKRNFKAGLRRHRIVLTHVS